VQKLWGKSFRAVGSTVLDSAVTREPKALDDSVSTYPWGAIEVHNEVGSLCAHREATRGVTIDDPAIAIHIVFLDLQKLLIVPLHPVVCEKHGVQMQQRKIQQRAEGVGPRGFAASRAPKDHDSSRAMGYRRK